MKTLSKKQSIELFAGFALLALVLLLGITGVINGDTVFFRCLIGIGFGYALTRGNFGFAGLSNNVCRTGSAKLIRGLMWTVVIASIFVGVVLIANGFKTAANPTGLALWVKPISWGLLAGGILFGIGMAFSSCCATGVLQDVPSGFTRSMVTLLFFGMGVFLGTPLWKTGFASNSLFTSASTSGVWFVDWFGTSDTVNGVVSAGAVVGAVLLTILIAVGISFLSKWYEKKIAKNFPNKVEEVEEVATTTYEKMFVKKWSMGTTALIIAVLFFALIVLTNAGWGASTVHGNWFASLLHDLGVSGAAIDSFMGANAGSYDYDVQYFQDAGSMQNTGIILGAFIALLLSGKFTETFTGGLKVKPIELVLFAAGGLLMGFGTRLSWGCNVGAFFTPVAEFSLAGWIYFFILFGGGFLGNKIYKAFYKKIS